MNELKSLILEMKNSSKMASQMEDESVKKYFD
jgi:hypothetical protein